MVDSWADPDVLERFILVPIFLYSCDRGLARRGCRRRRDAVVTALDPTVAGSRA